MKHWIRTVVGLAILAGALGLFGLAIYKLVDIGSCASGGPYVSARPCPPGTGWWIAAVFVAVIGFLIGIWVLVSRGGRPARLRPGLPPLTAPSQARSVPNLNSRLGSTARVPAMATAIWSPAPAAADSDDPLDRLERLAELRNTGVLTESEFQVQKAKLLGEL